jgi:predicted nucleic acid-binding protein
MSANIQRYCLDANVLIQAWRKYYSPKFCPEYWKLLGRLGHAGRIFLPSHVADEINKTEDDLSDWLKGSGIPIYPVEESVTLCLKQIYEADKKHKFLVDSTRQRSMADPWVIAHAMNQNGCVVTKEVKETAKTNRIKIPNVCETMGIRCIDDFQLIEELQIRFSCTLSV